MLFVLLGLTLNEPVTYVRCVDAIFSLHVYGAPPGPDRTYVHNIIPTYNDRVAIDFCNNLASLAVINAKCAGTNFCVGLIQLSFRTIVFTQYMQRCFQSKYYISIKLCGGFAL